MNVLPVYLVEKSRFSSNLRITNLHGGGAVTGCFKNSHRLKCFTNYLNILRDVDWSFEIPVQREKIQTHPFQDRNRREEVNSINDFRNKKRKWPKKSQFWRILAPKSGY